MRGLLILLVLLFVCAAQPLSADQRNYVWTYQYMTMLKGQSELEFYQTTKLRETDNWEYRIELESGLTERWDFSIYQIFSQDEGDAFKWNAVQLRTRYRLGEQGQYFMDPLLYLEYNRKVDLDKPHKLEGKLILAKTVERFNLAVNPVYEVFFSPGTEHEAGLDVGMSWEFSRRFSLGVESTSRWEFDNGDTEASSYLGPTISLSAGKVWYALGAAWGITDESDNTRVRFLMGVLF
jgi:hypothetical protein